MVPLNLAPIGQELIVTSIAGGHGMRTRLISMGLKENMKLKIIQKHGHGSCVVLAGHTRLVLGHGMAQKFLVKIS